MLGEEFFCPCCGSGRVKGWDDAAIGAELRRRRLARGVSQVSLGDEAGWAGTSIFYWETGRGVFTLEIVHTYLAALAKARPGPPLRPTTPLRQKLRGMARAAANRQVTVVQARNLFEGMSGPPARVRASDGMRRDPAFERVSRGVYRLREGV